SPAEVEGVLLEHPMVADAAVHGRADPDWGEAVVATVVLLDGAAIGADDLRSFCAERLASFKVPKEVRFAQALPRTESGKRLRRVKHALSASAHGERAETLTLAELGKRFRVGADEAPAVLAKAVKLGVLVPVSRDQYEVPSPSLLAVAEEVVGRGISVHSALDVLEEIDRHVDSVSRSFVKLFV